MSTEKNTRNIDRRINSTFALAPVLLIFSYLSFSQTWYNFNFHTSKLILPNSLKQFSNIDAHATFSGYDMMKNGTVISPFGISSAIEVGPLNLPMPFLYLIAAAMFVFIAIKAKTWMPTLVALYMCNLSRGQINNMRFSFESVTHGGKYITQGIGVTSFSNTIWLMAGLSLMVGLQLFKQRRENTIGKSILDVLVAVQSSHLTKIFANNKENTKEKTGA